MRVQENSFASCAKMTEERSVNGGPDIPSGSKRGYSAGDIDGTQSPNSSTSEADKSCGIAGGRLKFFKDGKFILELSHRTEGDRTSWVPVPKKTYWPPPATTATSTGTPRQESSTSLSVSDDNSSVQSSPWQRDHCWKQTNPRQGIGKEMTFVMQSFPHMRHLRSLHSVFHCIQKKRRCPYVPIEVSVENHSGVISAHVRGGKKERNRIKLLDIVQTLLDRVKGSSSSNESTVCSNASGAIPPNHVRTVTVATARLDPSIISPRKRILREMERVSLEDMSNSKRQRARTSSALPQNNNNGSSGNCTVTCQTLQPGSALPSPPQPSVKGSVSNYSITSLLGNSRNEDVPTPGPQDTDTSFLRTLLKSSAQQASSVEQTPRPKAASKPAGSRKSSPTQQQQQSPQQLPQTQHSQNQSPTQQQQQQQQLSSPSRLSSPALSPSPDNLRSGLRNPVVPSIGSSAHLSPFLTPPLIYPQLSSPFLPHPPPTLSHHPYYSSPPPVSAYRGSPSPVPTLWVQYPLSSLPRGAVHYGLVAPCHAPPLSPCHYSPLTQQPLEELKKEDNGSDVPLNLSKHSG
ncbi:protein hairless [Schistocerca cancellata]|uniref:protein hairless n=1 Tax=Schistocerca cancellata TaxID=274614 RepID=UPI0021183344|nr:protein hairless [Schistocerca cancellata]